MRRHFRARVLTFKLDVITRRNSFAHFSQVSGTSSYNSQELSSDNFLDVLSSAGFNNPSAQRTSGDKTTEVEITPYFSQHKSAVRTKHSSKSSSVKNQEEAGGFEDGRQLAPRMHEDFRPVRLRTNDGRKKHKVAIKRFIMRRAVRNDDGLEPRDNSGISQGDVDVSSLVRQAVKRGKDVALEQAKKTAANYPQETKTEGMNKLLEMAMVWKREHREPSNKMKTSWDTGTTLDASFLQDKEPVVKDKSSAEDLINMDMSVLQSTQPTSFTGVPYVTKLRTPPKLTILPIYHILTSAEESNFAKSASSDSTESNLELNLHTTESTTAESANLDSTEPAMNPNLDTAQFAKSDSEKSDPYLNLESAESKSVEFAKSDSGVGSAKSDSAGSQINLNTVESSASATSHDIPKQDSAEESTNKESTRNNREEPWRHEQPRVSRQERSPHRGTSTKPEVNANIHPAMGAPYSSSLRWNIALERRDTGVSESKKKKKPESQFETQDPADLNSPIIFGGLIGGIFMLLTIIACFMELW